MTLRMSYVTAHTFISLIQRTKNQEISLNQRNYSFTNSFNLKKFFLNQRNFFLDEEFSMVFIMMIRKLEKLGYSIVSITNFANH